MSGPAITFRRMTEADVPLVMYWLYQSHVAQWWFPQPEDPDEVRAKYLAYARGEKPTDAYLMVLDDRPIGYMQTYRSADWPEHQANIGAEPGAAGLDLFIGEADVLGRGIGRQVLTRFLSEIVFGQDGATCCYVDPEPTNTRAIKLYEAVGFRHLRTYQVPGEDLIAYLMRADRTHP